MKKYRLKNKEKINSQRKEYRLKNKEKANSYQREYQKKHPEKQLKRQIVYYKKLGVPNKLSLQEIQYALMSWSKTIRKLGNGLCQVCHSPAEISHHLIYKKTEPKLSLNVGNGIALCVPCHVEVHGWNISCEKV